MVEPNRKRFPLLSAEAFVSATDRAALENLQKMPALPMLIRKFNEWTLDHIYYAMNSAETVRCGPEQFPTLYALLKEACAIMDTREPELYVRYDYRYNAYTSGVNRTYIVLHSALIDDFTDEEILFVLGHELGHIKCGHVLYQMLARFLMPLLEAIGQATFGLGQLAGMGLMAGFLEWMRQAEFSCDRAGLLTCQDPETALRATMKLGAGSTRLNSEMSVPAFLEQAKNYSEDNAGLKGVSKAILFLTYAWHLDHPQIVYRAKELNEWAESEAFGRILGGNYPKDPSGRGQMGPQRTCRKCGWTVTATVQFCPQCGEDLPDVGGASAKKHCAQCHIDLPSDVSFCAHCGGRV